MAATVNGSLQQIIEEIGNPVDMLRNSQVGLRFPGVSARSCRRRKKRSAGYAQDAERQDKSIVNRVSDKILAHYDMRTVE